MILLEGVHITGHQQKKLIEICDPLLRSSYEGKIIIMKDLNADWVTPNTGERDLSRVTGFGEGQCS